MKFIALGGTDYIGASCYYLSIGGQKILLDCGKCMDERYARNPDFDTLLRQELLSLDDLDAVLLSHGHYDHVGSLELLRSLGSRTPAYATDLTISLMDALLVDKLPSHSRDGAWERLSAQMRNECAIQTIAPVRYGAPFQIGQVKATFYPAGHVPGAAMIYLESTEGSVLYTGDFQKESFGLTAGMSLPEDLHADFLIMCGTHAKHPNYVPYQSLKQQERAVRCGLEAGRTVHLKVSQLTKGLETAHWIGTRLPDAKIYLDRDTWNLGEKMEAANSAAIRPNFYRETEKTAEPGITIGGRKALPNEIGIDVNISLHAVYQDCEALISRVKPSTVFLVHSPIDLHGSGGNSALKRKFGRQIDILDPICGCLYSNQ